MMIRGCQVLVAEVSFTDWYFFYMSALLEFVWMYFCLGETSLIVVCFGLKE